MEIDSQAEYNHFCQLNRPIYFGKSPNENMILYDFWGTPIDCIVNLVCENENVEPYMYQKKIINFPIKQNELPDEDKIIELIKGLVILITRDSHILYICCDKGTDRASLVAGLTYSFLENAHHDSVLNKLTEAYEKRKVKPAPVFMKNAKYKTFMKNMLKPYNFYNSSSFLSNSSPHNVRSSKFNQTFIMSEALFQAYKSPDDKKYVDKLVKAKSVATIKKYGEEVVLRSDWDTLREEEGFHVKFYCMIDTLDDKIKSNEQEWSRTQEEIKIRPVFSYLDKDLWWDSGKEYEGTNALGNAWRISHIQSMF